MKRMITMFFVNIFIWGTSGQPFLPGAFPQCAHCGNFQINTQYVCAGGVTLPNECVAACVGAPPPISLGACPNNQWGYLSGAQASNYVFQSGLGGSGNCGCSPTAQPVCGSNGVTFTNECVARCQGMVQVQQGACPRSIGASLFSPLTPSRPSSANCNCPVIRDPVCANGREFANPCAANCEGFPQWSPGPCTNPIKDCTSDFDCPSDSFCRRVSPSTRAKSCHLYEKDGGVCGGTEPWSTRKCAPGLQCVLDLPALSATFELTASSRIVQGTCRQYSTQCSQCGDDYEPVCAGGLDFSSPCMAECQGQSFWRPGACAKPGCESDADCATTEFCRQIASSVSDRACYPRAGLGKVCTSVGTNAASFPSLVPAWKHTKCLASLGCVNGRCSSCNCGDENFPGAEVCVSGETFPSECFARCAGHTVIVPGACSQSRASCSSDFDCLPTQFCRLKGANSQSSACYERLQVGQSCTISGYSAGWAQRKCSIGLYCKPHDGNDMQQGGICARQGDCDCGAQFNPVCADNENFLNPCLASCNGFNQWKQGQCDSGCQSDVDCPRGKFCKPSCRGCTAKSCFDAAKEGAQCTLLTTVPKADEIRCQLNLVCLAVDPSSPVKQGVCRTSGCLDDSECPSEYFCKPESRTQPQKRCTRRSRVGQPCTIPGWGPEWNDRKCLETLYCDHNPNNPSLGGLCVAQQTGCDVCPDVYEPVCAAEANLEFNSACLAQCNGYQVFVDGPCDCNCPAAFDPVCANGVEYTNSCQARCHHIIRWVPGPCSDRLSACEQGCPIGRNPVCVGGRVEFLNECRARCQGYNIYDTFACPTTDCNCPDVYRPVCSSDNVTYKNACSASCAGVVLFIDGECVAAGGGGATGSGDEASCGCPAGGSQVCAEGKTFANACVVTCLGFREYTDGPCGTSVPDSGEDGANCGCPVGGSQVCAEGKTFANACIVACLQYREYTDGPCGTSVPDNGSTTGSVSNEDGANCGCPAGGSQVCAEGITFANACIVACLEYREYTQGPCPGGLGLNVGRFFLPPLPAPNDCGCPDNYSPVCARGKQYSNACLAGCAGGYDFQPGLCGHGQGNCNCEPVYVPVCANGQEYVNNCTARCQNVYNARSCDASAPCSCPRNHDPVCLYSEYGNRQFVNDCAATCEGIFNFVKGPCSQSLSSGLVANSPLPDCGCPEGGVPVCANGRQFANACQAGCARVYDYTPGPCSFFNTLFQNTIGQLISSISPVSPVTPPPTTLPVASICPSSPPEGPYSVRCSLCVVQDCLLTCQCLNNLGVWVRAQLHLQQCFNTGHDVKYENDRLSCSQPCNQCPPAGDEVCVDGITYGNPCMASCRGYSTFEPGPCEAHRGQETPCGCPVESDPVCAQGTQFQSGCLAVCAGFTPPFSPDSCATASNPCVASCPTHYDPVCELSANGDRRDHRNACIARCEGATGVVPGTCPAKGESGSNSSIASAVLVGPCSCPRIYEPVCAGGVTYNNVCLARCEGHHSGASGQCPAKNPILLSQSCSGRCNERFSPERTCHCDSSCVSTQDCCADYTDHCVNLYREGEKELSCTGRCNGIGTPSDTDADSTCYCDLDCLIAGDCCKDFLKLCPRMLQAPWLPLRGRLREGPDSLAGIQTSLKDLEDYKNRATQLDKVFEVINTGRLDPDISQDVDHWGVIIFLPEELDFFAVMTDDNSNPEEEVEPELIELPNAKQKRKHNKLMKKIKVERMKSIKGQEKAQNDRQQEKRPDAAADSLENGV